MKKFRIGLVSTERCSIGYQEQLLREGHSIEMLLLYHGAPITEDSGLALKYPKLFKCINLGSTYPKQRDMFGPLMRADADKLLGCDFIFFDYNRSTVLPAADYLRSKHAHVIGPTYFTNLMENDRLLGKTVANFAGMPSAKYQEFKTLDQAIKHVQKTKKNYLLKGVDDTVFPLNYRDCIDFMQRDQFDFIKNDGCIFLEEELIDNFEVTFSAWFNGDDYLPHIMCNREYKGMQPDTRGNVFCGEAGTLVELISWTDAPMQFRTAYTRLVEVFKNVGFKGYVDINSMLNRKTGVYNFLEFTMRPGIPTEQYVSAMFGNEQSYGQLLAYVSGFTTEAPAMPEYRQAVAVALMYYNPMMSASDKKIETIMPLIHGLDTLNYGKLRETRDNFVGPIYAVLQDARYEYDEKGKYQIRVWEHDRAVIFVGLHNDLCTGVDHIFDVLKAHPVEAWSHTYRDDIGADVLEHETQGLYELTTYCPGRSLKSVRDGSASKSTSWQLEKSEFTKEDFERTLILELNGTPAERALDDFTEYSPRSRVSILVHSRTGEDLGFLVACERNGYVYLENVVALANGYGFGKHLIEDFLESNAGKSLRLVCEPELETYYNKFGFLKYRQVSNDRGTNIYMESKWKS